MMASRGIIFACSGADVGEDRELVVIGQSSALGNWEVARGVPLWRAEGSLESPFWVSEPVELLQEGSETLTDSGGGAVDQQQKFLFVVVPTGVNKGGGRGVGQGQSVRSFDEMKIESLKDVRVVDVPEGVWVWVGGRWGDLQTTSVVADRGEVERLQAERRGDWPQEEPQTEHSRLESSPPPSPLILTDACTVGRMDRDAECVHHSFRSDTAVYKHKSLSQADSSTCRQKEKHSKTKMSTRIHPFRVQTVEAVPFVCPQIAFEPKSNPVREVQVVDGQSQFRSGHGVRERREMEGRGCNCEVNPERRNVSHPSLSSPRAVPSAHTSIPPHPTPPLTTGPIEEQRSVTTAPWPPASAVPHIRAKGAIGGGAKRGREGGCARGVVRTVTNAVGESVEVSDGGYRQDADADLCEEELAVARPSKQQKRTGKYCTLGMRGHSASQGEGPPVLRSKWGKRLCEHGRQRSRCKECGGSGICEHGRQRYSCKECGGSNICQHGRQRQKCKECGGSSICEHGRERYRCKKCGGSSICEHGRERRMCKECGGSNICEHGRQRSRCKECGGSSICEHGRERYTCKECGGRGICEHGRHRHGCKQCKKQKHLEKNPTDCQEEDVQEENKDA